MLAINVLISVLFFDSNVSLSGDDSDYIVEAFRFWHEGAWPGFRGALYPILLSPFIALFGIKLVLLKTISLLCILLMLYFIYKAFFQRIPSSILFFVLLLLSFNSYLTFYESQTFSEPLFMLLQTVLLVFFFKYFTDPCEALPIGKKRLLLHLVIACFILLVTLTRTVGYSAIGAVIIWFLCNKQWRDAIYAMLTTVAVFVSFHLLKILVWPLSGSSYDIKAYLVKDMYNPTKGLETLGGFVIRFIQNAEGYLSRNLSNFLGLRGESITPIQTSTVITIFFALFFIFALIMVWKKNKALFFTGLYTMLLCGAHFFLLQANWQQERFMLVLYPFILLLYFAAIYQLLKRYKKWQFLFPLLVGIISIGTLIHTGKKLQRHLPVLQQQLQGDKLYGFTPDWRNFILMSEWAAQNLPDSAVIASRKPSISCIYGNRSFVGIYNVPGVGKDTLATLLNAGNSLLVADVSKGKIDFLNAYIRFVVLGSVAINETTSSVVAIYEMDANMLAIALPMLAENNVAHTIEPTDFFADVVSNDKCVIHSPDDMLSKLKAQNIRYVLMANLRLNPAVNTGQIINTLHRYLYVVSLKYPDIVKQECYNIGGNEEPAVMLELNY